MREVSVPDIGLIGVHSTPILEYRWQAAAARSAATPGARPWVGQPTTACLPERSAASRLPRRPPMACAGTRRTTAFPAWPTAQTNLAVDHRSGGRDRRRCPGGVRRDEWSVFGSSRDCTGNASGIHLSTGADSPDFDPEARKSLRGCDSDRRATHPGRLEAGRQPPRPGLRRSARVGRGVVRNPHWVGVRRLP